MQHAHTQYNHECDYAYFDSVRVKKKTMTQLTASLLYLKSHELKSNIGRKIASALSE